MRLHNNPTNEQREEQTPGHTHRGNWTLANMLYTRIQGWYCKCPRHVVSTALLRPWQRMKAGGGGEGEGGEGRMPHLLCSCPQAKKRWGRQGSGGAPRGGVGVNKGRSGVARKVGRKSGVAIRLSASVSSAAEGA